MVAMRASILPGNALNGRPTLIAPLPSRPTYPQGCRKGRYTLSGVEDLLDRGKFMRWVGPDGDVHGAIVRAESAAMVFVIRDLALSDGLNVKRLALACDAYRDDIETDWNLHDINVTLPPWWRLETCKIWLALPVPYG